MEVARGLVGGIREDDVVEQCGRPAVVALVEGSLRELDDTVDAADRGNVALRLLGRRVSTTTERPTKRRAAAS